MIEVDLVYPVILFLLCTIVLWIYAHQICFFIISIYTARCSMHRKADELVMAPGVSVIKPLMGIDPHLKENLISHFTLGYPKFELLFCVQDENDSAIALVNCLREQYPHVDVRLFIGGSPGIINPMVHNMAPAYAAAKYELVWISTSRILTSTPVIYDFVKKLESPDVGMVHQTPFFSDHPGFLNTLEKVCFGCSISRNQIALNQLGILCFVGMSYMFKKSLLDDVGGLAYYGKYLAEDFFMSNAIQAGGHRVILSEYPALQNVATSSLRAYTDRMSRWLRLRLRMLPLVAGFLEPLTESITLGLLLSLALNYLFQLPIIYVLLVHFSLWISLDYTLLRCVQNGRLQFSFAKFLLAWTARELLVYWVFLRALYNPSVITWGRYSYRVKMGGITTRIEHGSCPRGLHKPLSLNSDLPNLQNNICHNHHTNANGSRLEAVRFQLPLNEVPDSPKATYLHKLPIVTKNGFKYNKLRDPIYATAVSTPQIEA